MARLTSQARKAMPAKDFALGKGHYPIEDRNHAKNALARVSQFGSSKEKAEVRSKVQAKYPGMGKSLRERGDHRAQKRAGNRDQLSHAEFHALDHGIRDHMAGRDGKC